MSYLDNLCVYLIVACYLSSLVLDELFFLSSSALGVCLDGLIPPPDTLVSGGLPLTHDDIRTYRVPGPPSNTTGSSFRSCMISTKNPDPFYTIRTRNDAIRLPHTRRAKPLLYQIKYPVAPILSPARPPAVVPPPITNFPPLRPSPSPRLVGLDSMNQDFPAWPCLTRLLPNPS